MEYHEKKYIVDCLSHNFKFKFINSKLNFYDLEGNEIELNDIVEYLFENFDMDFKLGMEAIVRWSQGDIHADMLPYNVNIIE